MASTVRIDGSLPDPGDNSTKGLIFSGGWGVDYEFAGDPSSRANQPRRLSDIGFPAPFDSDLEGALRGRGAFTQFLFLFKAGRVQQLIAATLQPDDEQDTSTRFGTPSDWTSFDAVTPGRGAKINFCYFFHGAEYVRFDWLQNAVSPGYPKSIATEWQTPPPFDADIDGVIAGQSGLTSKGFVFTTLPQIVNQAGALVAAGTPGSKLVLTPGFARYDFTADQGQGTVVAPPEVSTRWGGLLQLLDVGPAVDTALAWCDAAMGALGGPTTPELTTALTNHFMTGSPSVAELDEITRRMSDVRDRIAEIPDRFQWTRSLTAFAAQTVPGTLTEIGEKFTTESGVNGRAAILIHEAIHFVFVAGGLVIDVPEHSGATINGQTFGVVGGLAYSAMTPTQAIANPSSYAAFAQEIFFGADTRFGAARPHE